MEQKIIDWYAERKYQIQKIIDVGRTRHGLSQAQIEAAMEHCYRKITNGKPIRKIEIARYVFAVAKDIDCSKYAERIQAYKKSAEDRIKKAEAEINDLKKMVENAYAIGVVVSVAVLIFGVLISSWS